MKNERNIKEILKKYHIVEIAICCGYFLLLLIISLRNPFGSNHEEGMKYKVVNFIFENNKLPTLFDKSLYDYGGYGFSYAGQPILPYALAAIMMKIASILGVKTEYLHIPARMTSMILGVLFLVVVAKIADEVFENNHTKNIFVSIIVLWNYTVNIFTYINCDSTMLLGVAIIILSCIRGMKSEWKIKHCIWLAIGNSIILLSYINGGSYSIVSVFIFILSYVFLIRKKGKYIEMFAKGLMICVVAFCLSGWFYIRNILLYGSLFGSNIAHELGMKYGVESLTAKTRGIHAKSTMFSLSGFFEWVKGQAVSFCGKTIYKESIILIIIYWLLVLVVATLMLVAIYKIMKEWKSYNVENKIFTVSMMLGIIITIGVDFYYSAFVDYIPYYARYLMPMIISLGYFLTQGIVYISAKLPYKQYKKKWLIIPSCMIILNIITFVV